MNSQDLQNLSEAYLEVYGEGFKPLPKGKMESQIKKFPYDHPDTARKSANIGIVAQNIGKSQQTKSFGKNEEQRRKSAKHHAKAFLRQLPYSSQATKERPDPTNKKVGFYIIRDEEAKKKHLQRMNKEQVDIYDIIFSHLLDEGYAETPEAAQAIMVNMSEEWKDVILEKE